MNQTAKGKYMEWIEPDGLLKIEGWARDGLTDKQIASNIGISEQTLNIWKKNYPSFFKSLKKGKEVIDRQVENALLKRALGYKYKETTRTLTKDGAVLSTKIIEKEIAPDVTAQIFWLKNRKSLEWRDRKNLDLSGGVSVTNPFEEVTTEDLKKVIENG